MDISALIKRSGKTQKQIADEVGCSQPYLSLIGKNERKPGVNMVAALAKSLGVEPSDLRPDLAIFSSPSSAAQSKRAS